MYMFPYTHCCLARFPFLMKLKEISIINLVKTSPLKQKGAINKLGKIIDPAVPILLAR